MTQVSHKPLLHCASFLLLCSCLTNMSTMLTSQKLLLIKVK